MQLATIDIVVVAVYFVAIFGLAQYVSREKAGHEKTSPVVGARRPNRTITADVGYGTSASFNIMSLGGILILIALYATWW